MRVALTDIRTPTDSPHAYSTEWRHEAAAALAGYDGCHAAVADDYVFAQTQYLKMCRDERLAEAAEMAVTYSSTSGSILSDVIRANDIRGGTDGSYTSQRLEALLLCPELSYLDIASEFNLWESAVKAFEKLFYNVRDDEGRLLESKGFLIYCALKGASSFRPDPERPNQPETDAMYWRVLAFENGYKALYNAWGFRFDRLPGYSEKDVTAELLRQVLRRIDKAMKYNERISMRDLASLVNTLTERLAEMREAGLVSSSGRLDGSHMMLKLMELLAPNRLLDSSAFSEEKDRELVDRMMSFKTKDGRTDASVPAALENINAQLTNAAPQT